MRSLTTYIDHYDRDADVTVIGCSCDTHGCCDDEPTGKLYGEWTATAVALRTECYDCASMSDTSDCVAAF